MVTVDWVVFIMEIMRWENCKSMYLHKSEDWGTPALVGTWEMGRLLATASIQQPCPPTGC